MAKYTILYQLQHANGALVDESWDEPLFFEVGDGQLDSCLEACVQSAKVGQLQTFLLAADEAFGGVDFDAIQTMHRTDFPKQLTLEENAIVEFKTPAGESYAGCIDKIDGDDIRVSFNHPLAGCDISFQVKILEKVL